MSLRKRLVLGAVLALLLTAMMGMLAYLSNAHRQLSETYEVQAALLAERMEHFISHPDAIREMGRTAEAYALEHFTIERCAKEIADVYREVTADHE